MPTRILTPDIESTTNLVSESTIAEWLHYDNIPPWRQPNVNLDESKRLKLAISKTKERDDKKGLTFRMPRMKSLNSKSTKEDAYNAINIALLLRRPILLKGTPGIGKSSMAYFLAYRLGLGKPLVWPINSKSILKEGLYTYDAVGHLGSTQKSEEHSIYGHVTLNALGEALLPWTRPRVLLIDELDKASYDLPNDLLHILEEGSFTIPEIRRSAMDKLPQMADKNELAIMEYLRNNRGSVEMYHPPVMVITSNNERDFSEAFLRRCVVLDLEQHDELTLRELILAHLSDADLDSEIATEILKSNQPTDVILQAFYVATQQGSDEEQVKFVLDLLKRD